MTIKRIVLDLHDVSVDSKKVPLLEKPLKLETRRDGKSLLNTRRDNAFLLHWLRDFLLTFKLFRSVSIKADQDSRFKGTEQLIFC